MKPGILITLFALGLLGLAPGVGAEEAPVAVVAAIAGPISPATAQFSARAIETAEKQEAAVAVLLLDTPGGLDTAMRLMVQAILGAEVPVIVYVYPPGARAASAGLMVTLAAHVAAMAPGTNIGAAHPVAGGGKEIEGVMGLKVTNDMVAYVRSLAHKRGRNADWAEKAVRDAAALPAVEAAGEGVIDVVAPNLEVLLDWADGREVTMIEGTVILKTRGARIVTVEPSFRDRVLGTIADPSLAYLLLMIGLLAIYFEFSHPGAILPGVVGAICLILAFFALQTLSVSVAGLLLIIVGVALFLIEIKVVSYGLLSLAGVGCLFLGSVMLFDSPDAALRLAWTTILPTVIAVSAFFIGIVILAVKAQTGKKMMGLNGLVGARAEVLEWNGAKGRIFVRGEIWRAESTGEFATKDEVEIVGGEGLKLKVKKVEE